MEWQPIETAPNGQSLLVADSVAHTVAKAHRRGDIWAYGGVFDDWIEEVDFEPRWWLPRDYEGNPFFAPLPQKGEDV